MKLKYLSPIIFIFFVVGLFSFSVSKTAKIYIPTPYDTSKNYLAIYGEYIFKREGCMKCHTLLQTTNKNFISLDGLQQRGISNSWHFKHLQDPQAMVDNSPMPPFDYLNNILLNKDSLPFNTSYVKDSIWAILLEAADTILVDLKKFNIAARPKSEMLALIAYLQNIPTSDELAKKIY